MKDITEPTDLHEAAFPEAVAADSMGGLNFSRNTGLTKREYFAAVALQGMLANSQADSIPAPGAAEERAYGMAYGYAKCAVRYADALFEALEE